MMTTKKSRGTYDCFTQLWLFLHNQWSPHRMSHGSHEASGPLVGLVAMARLYLFQHVWRIL